MKEGQLSRLTIIFVGLKVILGFALPVTLSSSILTGCLKSAGSGSTTSNSSPDTSPDNDNDGDSGEDHRAAVQSISPPVSASYIDAQVLNFSLVFDQVIEV